MITEARGRMKPQRALPKGAPASAHQVLALIKKRRMLEAQLRFEPTQQGKTRILRELTDLVAELAAIKPPAPAAGAPLTNTDGG